MSLDIFTPKSVKYYLNDSMFTLCVFVFQVVVKPSVKDVSSTAVMGHHLSAAPTTPT